MKVHLIPSIINKYLDVKFNLIDIHFPELQLTLKNGLDVVIGTPYPNKTIYVAHCIRARKMLNGILLYVPDNIMCFSMITRWRVGSEKTVIHKVNFKIIDTEYDVATQDPVMWYANFDNSKNDRWPCEHKTPCYFNPRFEVILDGDNSKKEGDFQDFFENGVLVYRVEHYKMPTIKLSNLDDNYQVNLKRMPHLDSAINIIM